MKIAEKRGRTAEDRRSNRARDLQAFVLYACVLYVNVCVLGWRQVTTCLSLLWSFFSFAFLAMSAKGTQSTKKCMKSPSGGWMTQVQVIYCPPPRSRGPVRATLVLCACFSRASGDLGCVLVSVCVCTSVCASRPGRGSSRARGSRRSQTDLMLKLNTRLATRKRIR